MLSYSDTPIQIIMSHMCLFQENVFLIIIN